MRVSFLVDGFNLYHSIRAAQRATGLELRWLDLQALCRTLLHSAFGPGYSLAQIHYFSALATHLEHADPDVVRRHRLYREALAATGVHTSFSRFKRKERRVTLDRGRVSVLPWIRRWRLNWPRVRFEYRTHEEKETDVAIACRIFELLHTDATDVVVLVTGDTDLAPAIRMAQTLFPQKEVAIALPYDRYNEGLARLVKRRIKLDPRSYQRHQFPDVITLVTGRTLRKPATW